MVAPKKGGKIQLDDDYTMLNIVTFRDSCTIYHVDDCIDSLGDVTTFSTLDVNSGYCQVEFADEDSDKATSTSYDELFVSIRMPFLLKKHPVRSNVRCTLFYSWINGSLHRSTSLISSYF